MMDKEYLAHSARDGSPAQTYLNHVQNVRDDAVRYAKEASAFAKNRDDGIALVNAVINAAVFHDLGKLEEENQSALHNGNQPHLPINHTDAGTALLLHEDRWCSAICVMSHHRGLPDFSKENGRDDSKAFRDADIAAATDSKLPDLKAIHQDFFQEDAVDEKLASGYLPVFMRLALSCLADADHGDTARHYSQESIEKEPSELRPVQRLQALNAYVSDLQADDERSRLRTQMYECCRDSKINDPIVACDSPVGSGKTTAVMPYMLSQAAKHRLRRIFVVLPFTNIISQSVETYRQCLVLPGENPKEIVAEVHHRVDFESESVRHLSAQWKAPIIVTTAVAFFETLASNRPSALRRLHELPGSAIFVDEAHAALPSHLLPVAWKWINCFADEWNCHWVLASGSLNRFWMIRQIAAAGTRQVPDLIHKELRSALEQYEQDRIQYPWEPSSMTSKELAQWVNSFPGPRLLIVNTVQSAAAIAKTMMELYGRKRVEHLSTALTARDRADTLAHICQRLGDTSDSDWTLVATSCVEAGVNLSFAVGFREMASLSSLLQASGRVNRNGKTKNARMYSFSLNYTADALLKKHPLIEHAAKVLIKKFFERNRPILPTSDSDSVTYSVRLELDCYGERQTDLLKDDANLSFAQVEGAFRVIESRSVSALVHAASDEDIHIHQISREQVQMDTVQIPQDRIKDWNVQPIRDELYRWTLAYDSFLGYMAGVLGISHLYPNKQAEVTNQLDGVMR